MDKKLDLYFICRTFGLPLPPENRPVAKIVTDSRLAGKDDVFFALRGENFDGHDFVADVAAKGAAAVVSREGYGGGAGVFRVDDTQAALQTQAAAWRDTLAPFVIGITGSVGKTTVKEMTAAVLRRHFGKDAVLATEGNFNNHIGLPLTLLSLRPQHTHAVIEMGMNHFGELALLTRLAKPDAALVNNALRAHIGCGFDGVGDIARAKSEIYQGVSPDGLALLPCEDANFAVFQTACAGLRTKTFGVGKGDVHAENISLQPFSSRFDLAADGVRAPVELPVPGRHNIHNAVAAAALARAAGLSLAQAAQGLETFSNIKGRLKILRGIKGATLIDDTYNANPDSMKAAIDVLAAMPAPRIFVMGDMGELGAGESAGMHKEIGAYAAGKDIEAAYFVGNDSADAAEAFGGRGLWFADKDPLIQVMCRDLPERASILVKGSRFMKMEEVVAALNAGKAD